MRKSRKIYFTLVVSLPFGIAAAVWASAEGNMSRTIYYGSVLAVYSVCLLLWARQYLIRENGEEADYNIGEITHRRRIIFIWIAFWSLFLIAAVITVARSVFIDISPHLILWGVWIITTCCSFLFLTPLF